MHCQSVSQLANLQHLIRWSWIVGFLIVMEVVTASSYLNHFDKNEATRLLPNIQSTVLLGGIGDSRINKRLNLKTYAIDPRINRIRYIKGQDKKPLTVPIVGDESRTIDLKNIQQSDRVIEYLDRIREITPDTAAAIYNHLDSEEEQVDEDYDNFKIQLLDGRLDDDGPVFFNIDDGHNTI